VRIVRFCRIPSWRDRHFPANPKTLSRASPPFRSERRSREWAYILRGSDDSLYVGVTSDLATRVEQHQAGCAASSTARRRPVVLVYSEEVKNTADAISRERQLKGWSANKKRALIRGELETLRQLRRRGWRKDFTIPSSVLDIGVCVSAGRS